MWLLLDDFADSVDYKPYKTGRIAVCGLLLAGCAASCIFSFAGAKKSAAAFAANEQTIASLQAELSDAKIRQTELNAVPKEEYYEVAGVCDKIAELQTAYGNLSSTASLQAVSDQTKEVRSAMDAYITSGSSGAQWFMAPSESYGWYTLTKADSVVSSVPVAWECTGRDNKVYAVCFGTYDGNSMRCGQFDVHTTHEGYLLTAGDTADGSFDGNEAADVAGIQNSVSESESGSGSYTVSAENEDNTPAGLPKGYTESDRASEADVSLENNTPVCTETEAKYAENLDDTTRQQFYALNHKARDRFMSENPLPAQGDTSATTVQSTPSSSGSSSSSAPAAPAPKAPATGTQKLTNEEVLQQILQ